MKRVIGAILITVLIIITLSGCSGDVVDVEVVLKNSTGYELEKVIFQIPQTSGSYSPMHDLVTSENEPLKPNEEREITVGIYESDLGNQGVSIIYIKGDETRYGEKNSVSLKKGTNRFEITCDDDMNFTVKAAENQ